MAQLPIGYWPLIHPNCSGEISVTFDPNATLKAADLAISSNSGARRMLKDPATMAAENLEGAYRRMADAVNALADASARRIKYESELTKARDDARSAEDVIDAIRRELGTYEEWFSSVVLHRKG